MTEVTVRMRTAVVFRANDRCEYCGLAQEGQEATFHIDHVMPRSNGGKTVLNNLALACVSCSLHKAARRSAQDPQTGRSVPLFHPRRQRWTDHFLWRGSQVIGRTPTGRTTIAALRMNRPAVLAIRVEEIARNRHPPPGIRERS